MLLGNICLFCSPAQFIYVNMKVSISSLKSTLVVDISPSTAFDLLVCVKPVHTNVKHQTASLFESFLSSKVTLTNRLNFFKFTKILF